MNSISYNKDNRIMYMMERTTAYTIVSLFFGGVLTAAWAISVGFFIIFFGASMGALS